jgi:hypothetical protein
MLPGNVPIVTQPVGGPPSSAAEESPPASARADASPADQSPDTFVPRVFISHSSADYDASGQPDDEYATGLLGGDRWWQRIKSELNEREVFVAILSPEAMASRWVRDEIDLAWAADKIIVPVLHRRCEIPADLRLIQHVSFLPPRLDTDAFAEFLSAVRLGKSRRLDSGARILRPIGMPLVQELFGRDREFAQIVQAFSINSTAGICALKGMGGIGKSALAAKITEKLAGDAQVYPGGGAWIPCDRLQGDEGLDEIYRRVARLVGRDDIALDDDRQTRLRHLAEALALRPRTLLTLDNIEPGIPVGLLVRHLAIPGCVGLLLTSRQQLDASLDQQVTLEPLVEHEGAHLFVQGLKRNDSRRPTPEDDRYISDLVISLGGLPLAIALTAAYCSNQKLSARRLLETLTQQGLGAGPLQGLRECFDRSWQALPPNEQHLFAGLSLFAGPSVPRTAAQMMAVALDSLTGAGDPLEHGRDNRPSLPNISNERSLVLTTAMQFDALARIDRVEEGDPAVSALVDAAVVEAVSGERLRLHPLLRDYAEEHFNHLPQGMQETLGIAMVEYWVTFANQNANEFGDLALKVESEGLKRAIDWARQHRRDDFVWQIIAAQARAGTERVFHYITVLSRFSEAYTAHPYLPIDSNAALYVRLEPTE